MNLYELLLIALGLSMDAFAVALCKGVAMQTPRRRAAGVIALFFGTFQALMPFLGWLVGRRFQHLIVRWDHWIAFTILGIIGAKMLFDAFQKPEQEECPQTGLRIGELFLLAIATSIDALAVGITFAFLQVNIVPSVLLIGIVTLLLSFIGVRMGGRFPSGGQNKAQILGGLTLMLIGTKILFEHLNII